MAFMYYEGTKDYVAATPVLITTFKASGSITAGRIVVFDTGDNSSNVYQPPATTASGALAPVGLAIKTVSDGDDVPVIVWGFAKNIATKLAGNPGDPIVISGSGYVAPSGSTAVTTGVLRSFIGKWVSGSSTSCMAFIDCMR